MLLLNMRYSNLVEELEKLRAERRLSVPEMASKVGISYPGMRKILNGETTKIQDSTLRAISEAFDVEIIEDGDQIFFQSTVIKGGLTDEQEALLKEIQELTDEKFVRELREYLKLRLRQMAEE